MSSDIEAANDPDSKDEVQVDDPASVKRWCAALGVTDEALLTAVQAVGRRIDRIKVYLGSGGMAGDQEDA